MKKTRTVGRTVELKLINGEYEIDVIAKVDTGAFSSSIDESIAKELNLTDKPVKYMVKSASGSTSRDFFSVLLSDGFLTTETLVNIAVRKHLKYKMILGTQDILDLKYIVDVSEEIIKYQPLTPKRRTMRVTNPSDKVEKPVIKGPEPTLYYF